MDLLPPGLSVAWRTLRPDVWNAVMDIETSRLILRRPVLADAPRLFEFLGDTKAMQYTHVDGALKQCRRRIAVHERRRRRDGFAPWTILSKMEHRIIGWGGLYEDPFHPGSGAEVGYFFDPAYWGHGYASELALACAFLADKVLKLPEVRAFAHPKNIGSQRVLEKAGFQMMRSISEMDRLLYSRSRRCEPMAG
jgi:RimJ/RimL family protein N-acetyltransferase